MNRKRLSLGEATPRFQIQDWQGKPVGLDDAHPGLTLLSFFRYASCPLCNLRTRELIRQHRQLTDWGIRVLAVFQSPAERIESYVGCQSPLFQLIS